MRLNNRIEIQSYEEVENEAGEIIKQWKTYKKLWSQKLRLRGSNSYTDNKEEIEYTYRFKIRYRTDINESMRVVYKGIIYDIKHINFINEPGTYETHLDCVYYREGVYNE